MAEIPITQIGPDDAGQFEYHWQGDFLEAHLISDVGKKRERNEDSCLMCAPADDKLEVRRGRVFAVADGMGGVSGGAFASRLALDTVNATYYGAQDNGIPPALRRAIEAANTRIYEEAGNQPEYRGMGTTVSMVAVMGEHIYIGHVGDSRVYLKRNGMGLTQLTRDHSLVAEQVRNGFISEEEARTHSLRNLITRAVGTRETIKTDLYWTKIRAGDVLLICSDGLCGVIEDDVMDKALQVDNLAGTARSLVGRALEAGGPDNITAILIKVTAAPPKGRLDEGAEKILFEKPGFISRLLGRTS
ncbi:MAG: Stp1/IreP family PP2C-type Ser/Thr phosphatase [Candidatus Hydrogenedentes bacterium]|nr:Stp1/IreP family PP2C-type Ser/Thr phosphatase [Candidatus Hydrogenedentota bacterium]